MKENNLVTEDSPTTPRRQAAPQPGEGNEEWEVKLRALLDEAADLWRSHVDQFGTNGTDPTWWEYSSSANRFVGMAEHAWFHADDRYRGSEWIPDPEDGEHVVYRLWTGPEDALALLYVGVTSHFADRMATHRARWGEKITVVTFDRYPTRAEAGAAEQEAIRSEGPLANVVGVA